jgi:Arc/MetJ-type ribon-helix-helix transcriptional regulator
MHDVDYSLQGPAMTVTVKLDAQLEERLRQRAAGSGLSTSDVIRAALVAYLDQGEREAPRSAFDLGADLFGRHGGPPDLAQRGRQSVAEAWGERHDRRGA